MKNLVSIALALACLGVGAAGIWLALGTAGDQAPESGDASAAAGRLKPQPSIRIRNLVGRLKDDSITWQDRVAAAHEIPEQLQPQEIDFLFEYLESHPQGSGDAHYLVVNEVMERLRLGGQAGETYAEKLASLIGNPAVDPIVRDYAIQHSAIWLDPAGVWLEDPEAPPVALEERRRLLDAILAAVTAPENLRTTIPGTGLTALTDVSIALPGALSERTFNRLRPVIFPMINGSLSSTEANRIAAVDVAARLQLQRAHADIRALVESPQTSPSLRLASIAALGTYGRKTDVPALNAVADGDQRYAFAARAALQRIQTGQGPTAIPELPLKRSSENSESTKSTNEDA